jgi:predicted RNA-binding protein Jag
MRDLVFSAATVGEAVETAAAALGIEPGNLRYIVVETGSPAVGKRAGAPARIAVLAERRGSAEATLTVPADAPSGEPQLHVWLTELAEALSRASDEEVHFELVQDEDAPEIRVVLDDKSILLSGEGGEAFRALEHLLRRVALQATGAHRVVVSNASYRAIRESALRGQAESLAAAVRDDGVPRVLEKLTSYERRIVHMALTEVPGVRTRSEGAGAARLLVIEPAPLHPPRGE